MRIHFNPPHRNANGFKHARRNASVLSALPPWLQYCQAFALILFPLIAAYVAWKQMDIAAKKLQHDLYERRYKIYEATREMLGAVLSKAQLTDEEFFKFSRTTADAIFIFDDKVVKFLERLKKDAAAILTYGPIVTRNLNTGNVGGDHPEYLRLYHQALFSLLDALNSLEDQFLAHMRLERLSILQAMIKRVAMLRKAGGKHFEAVTAKVSGWFHSTSADHGEHTWP